MAEPSPNYMHINASMQVDWMVDILSVTIRLLQK